MHSCISKYVHTHCTHACDFRMLSQVKNFQYENDYCNGMPGNLFMKGISTNRPNTESATLCVSMCMYACECTYVEPKWKRQITSKNSSSNRSIYVHQKTACRGNTVVTETKNLCCSMCVYMALAYLQEHELMHARVQEDRKNIGAN